MIRKGMIEPSLINVNKKDSIVNESFELGSCGGFAWVGSNSIFCWAIH